MNVNITRSGHPGAVVDETDGRIDEIRDRERLQDGISHRYNRIEETNCQTIFSASSLSSHYFLEYQIIYMITYMMWNRLNNYMVG